MPLYLDRPLEHLKTYPSTIKRIKRFLESETADTPEAGELMKEVLVLGTQMEYLVGQCRVLLSQCADAEQEERIEKCRLMIEGLREYLKLCLAASVAQKNGPPSAEVSPPEGPSENLSQ